MTYCNKVTMVLLSDTIFGSGHSIPGGEDIAVRKDRNGYPFLAGETFKGLLRSEVENWLDWTQPERKEQVLLALFGESGCWTGNNASSPVFVTPFALQNGPAAPEDCFSERAFTAMEQGIVKRGSLRLASCVLRGLCFSGTVTCETEDDSLLSLLDSALRCIKFVGTNRNRGFGRVRVQPEGWTGAAPESAKAVPGTGDFLLYRLSLLEPVRLTDRASSYDTFLLSRQSVPGSSIRGAVLHTLANRDSAWFEAHKRTLLKHLPKNAVFQFTMLLKTSGRDMEAEGILEEALSALNSGLITLGGQRSNGFGLVSLSVRRHDFDLLTQQGRQDWLGDATGDVPVMLQPLEPEGVVFRLEGTSPDFLIRSGKPAQKSQGEDKASVMSAMQNADGTYVLPGSSLKGVLRNRAKLIASCLRVSDMVETLFGRTAQGADDGLPGHVVVREFTLQKPSKQVITRTRIDRFTGGVMPQHLFSEERLADRVAVEACLTISDASACGILFFTLRDLAMGLYGFGSGTSTGRGVLEADNSRLTVRRGQRTCSFTFEDGKTISSGDEEMVRQWLTAMQERSGGVK